MKNEAFAGEGCEGLDIRICGSHSVTGGKDLEESKDRMAGWRELDPSLFRWLRKVLTVDQPRWS